MRRTLVLAVTLVVGLVAERAIGHVAPSVDDNNRYLKLTPQADRVRLAYTVFFGEVPGAQMRPSLDTNRDGRISDAEADSFGSRLAADVAGALDVTVDGRQTTVAWTEVVAGMGSPAVKAGSFSIDLVASLCLASGTHHTVTVRDRFRIPRPGETEVRVDGSPGIAITSARIGGASDPSHMFKFVGPGGPLTDDGIEVVFDVANTASASGACDLHEQRGLPTGLVIGVAAGLGCVLALAVTLVRRRRRPAA